MRRKQYNLKEMKGIRGKIQDMDKRMPRIKQIKELIKETLREEMIRLKQVVEHDSGNFYTNQEILELDKLRYSCTPVRNDKQLMRKKLLGQLPS